MKNMKEIFPNITRVLSILLTTVATSGSLERVNSALQQVKTDFRSIMGEERLNAFLLVHIHRDIFLEYDKIFDMYASKCPRRMLLINPLSDNHTVETFKPIQDGWQKAVLAGIMTS